MNSLAVSDAAPILTGEPSFRAPLVDAVIDREQDHSYVSPSLSDSLSRDVYCVLGIPIDSVSMASMIHTIEAAATRATRYLISTPNLNFLVASRDPEFRESLLLSNLCAADGMPIVWIARLLGLPITERIAGSDMFQELKSRPRSERPLTVFFFGGAEGVAAAAANALNHETDGRLTCVGHLNPGFGSLDDLSRSEVITAINSSKADFLLVALGAKNGQAWLARNHHRLTIPVRSHLGATINFQAGTLKRAPRILRKLGLEWLWRIKEEPNLWRRYWHDGWVLLRLLVTRVLPLVAHERLLRLWPRHDRLHIDTIETDDALTLRVSGTATAQFSDMAILHFRKAAMAKQSTIILDVTEMHFLDARFLGILLMLRRELKERGAELRFAGVSASIRRLFRLHEGSFLLSDGRGH